MHIEHITLQPHPLDAWRRALDILIACAPGHPADVANHLRDAAMGMGAKPAPSEQEARLVQRLLIATDVTLHQAADLRSLERTVSSRLTVMVEGTDYDVSGLSGVLVGDVIRVDLDNMPPVLSRDWGFARPQLLEGGHQSLRGPDLCHGRSSAAVGQPDSASAPLQQGEAALSRQSANESSPAATGYSARPVCSATHPAQETPPEGHQGAPAEPQHPDHS